MSYTGRFNIWILIALVCLPGFACKPPAKQQPFAAQANPNPNKLKSIVHTDTAVRVIHVFVALCDNKYQGIVPVPASIGNGQDPETNLY